MVCLFLSTTALQLLSSMLNFLDVSNFFRDFAWGALLLIFLAFGRYELFAKAREKGLQFISWVRSPPGPKSYS
jgi:simple sugar transport system permease protein